MNTVLGSILTLIIGGAGFIVLCYVDWHIAVGVALMMWGNNLDLIQKWKERHDGR